MIAMVVLPDHLHCVWSLPAADVDYSTRWKIIKQRFSFRWLRAGGDEVERTDASQFRGERGIWQRRFWEHFIRDEADLECCCDYIHFNPVKHRFAKHPSDWPWSTFSRFVRQGDYPSDWAETEPPSIHQDHGGFGE